MLSSQVDFWRGLNTIILGSFDGQTTFCYPLIISYALYNVLRAVAVCILNFTQLNTLKKKSARTLFVFSKLTILMIFIENLLRFMVSLWTPKTDLMIMQEEKVSTLLMS